MLEIKELNKVYGTNHALKDFSYQFTAGVYGLLGPNGAGKSTLMNIITDNLSATSGEVVWHGENTLKMGKMFRKVLGYMPQQQGMYSNFTLIRFLYYMAALKGMSKSDAEDQIEKYLKSVNLQDVKFKKLGTFSGGMKQRALIAQAMLGNPKVLILDEPTAGLDPKERIRIRNIISEIAFDKIVIIATHVVSDIEFIAKEILFLKKGIIVKSGVPHEICNGISGKVFEIKAPPEKLDELSKEYKIGNISKDEKFIYVRVVSDEKPNSYGHTEVKPTLEDLYLYIFDEGAKL